MTAAGDGDNARETAVLLAKLAEQQKTIEAQKKTIDTLEAGKAIDLSQLPGLVESLDREDEISEKIRALAHDNLGPWSPYLKSQDMLVSVPGGLADGIVLGCPSTRGKTLELLSRSRSPPRPFVMESLPA